MWASADAQADGDAHELLLGAVVQVALDPPSRGVARLHDARARGAQLGLRPPALRDVAQKPVNIGAPGTSMRVIVSSTGNRVPSDAHGVDLEAPIQHPRRAAGEVTREPAPVALAQVLRHDQLGHLAADRLPLG